MAETAPKGSLFKPNWGNAELYIFKSSLSSNVALSWLIPKKSARPKSTWEHVTFYVLIRKFGYFAKL